MTKPLPEFGAQDLEVVQRTPGYRGFFAIDKVVLKHRLYAGGWSPPFTRELFLRDPAAGVLLYDPDCDQLVLVEQFRIGALQDAENQGVSPWLLEVVAGIMAPEESAVDLSRREAKEEAGCDIQDLIHITDYYNSPGGSNERISLYCGRVDASSAGGIHGLEEENEDIRALVLSFDEAWQALQEGRMNNAMAIIAMQWLYINRPSLRHKWLSPGPSAA
jgi:ADP-ribose pyrophosphatase